MENSSSISNVGQETWRVIKEKHKYWKYVVAVSVLWSLFSGFYFEFDPYVIFAPWIFLMLYYSRVVSSVRTEFWKQFAVRKGWLYAGKHNISDERGVIFKLGNKRSRKAFNMVKSVIDEGSARIFNYSFTTGSGKHKENHYYTVFEFRTSGSFPHVYLNRIGNMHDINVGESISLPAEFEKKFSLHTSRKYEIEALQIFEPDTLAHILDVDLKYDVEFVDGDMLFYVDGHIDTTNKLETEFSQINQMYEFMARRLDKMKLYPIGDMPHYL